MIFHLIKQMIVGLLLLPATLFPCSSFLLEDLTGFPGQEKVFMGKSYDYALHNGFVLHNKKGMRKKSLALKPRDLAVEWTADYDSLTVTQFGRFFPLEGINNEGLAIQILWLNGSQYEAEDSRSTLNELEWIQYHLDNFASVEEMMEAFFLPDGKTPRIRVSPIFADVHFLVCDRQKNCRLFEWLDGELSVQNLRFMDIQAITNSTYKDSFQFFINKRPESSKSLASLFRYDNIAESILAHPNKVNSNDIFSILDKVRQPHTIWQSAYRLDQRSIQIKKHQSLAGFYETPLTKTVQLTDEKTSACGPPQYLDLDQEQDRWEAFTPEKNRQILLGNLQLLGLDAQLADLADQLFANEFYCEE